MMKKRNISLLLVWTLFLLSLGAETSVAYLAGFSLTDNILYGTTSWDHMLESNSHLGINITYPNPEHDVFKTRVRIAYTLPTWAKVYQLDGEDTTLFTSGTSFNSGYDFFIGVFAPLPWSNDFFETNLIVGPVTDFYIFDGDYLFTSGLEVGLEGNVKINESFDTGLGLSFSYSFFGVHTVGDSTKYELFIKRGLKGMIYPYIKYSF